MQVGLLAKRQNQHLTIEEYMKTNKIQYLNYRDTFDANIFDEYDMNEDIVLFDRNNVLCTPIPYQNEWLTKTLASKSDVKSKETMNALISSHLKEFFKSKEAPKGFNGEELNAGPFCLVKVKIRNTLILMLLVL